MGRLTSWASAHSASLVVILVIVIAAAGVFRLQQVTDQTTKRLCRLVVGVTAPIALPPATLPRGGDNSLAVQRTKDRNAQLERERVALVGEHPKC